MTADRARERDEIDLRILGMTCDGCATHVRAALTSVPGVLDVDIPSWRAGRGRVVVQRRVRDDDLVRAVRDAGYDASVESRRPLRQAERTRVEPSPGDTGGTAFDLIVIGTGGAGMATAIRAVEIGARVAIVESGVIGGTCVNIGCIPSKVLMRAAQALTMARKPRFRGVHVGAVTVDWREIVAQKDETVHMLRRKKYVDVLASYGDSIRLFRGRARIVGDGRVRVGENGPVLTARGIVVATGARPRILDIPGIEGVDVLTSTSVMAMDRLPESIVIIGGRSVALEIGHVLTRFGTRTMILQRSGRILPDHEPEISDSLAQFLRSEGMDIVTGVRPVSVRQDGEEVVVTAEVGDETREFRAERLMMAVGRVPNTSGLGLEEVGVRLDDRGDIIVDDRMRTSNPHIFAAGDVATLPKFVYVAAASGKVAAENALSDSETRLDLSVMPSVTFTDPQVAMVGLTQRQAEAQGLGVTTTLLDLEHVPRAVTSQDTRGLIKMVVDSATRRLLGAHILAAEAGEIVQTASIAIAMGHRYGLTVDALTGMLFPYLTMMEGIKLAALSLDKDVSQLSCCAG